MISASDLMSHLPIHYLRLGNAWLWNGNEGSSVMCQWKTFILFISIKSRFDKIDRFERKCRELSNITPRWLNLGPSCTYVVFTWYYLVLKCSIRILKYNIQKRNKILIVFIFTFRWNEFYLTKYIDSLTLYTICVNDSNPLRIPQTVWDRRMALPPFWMSRSSKKNNHTNYNLTNAILQYRSKINK